MLRLLCPKLAVLRIERVRWDVLADRGIRGVLLDVDNTLAQWHCNEVSGSVIEWMQELKAHGIKACIVSNSLKTHRIQAVSKQLDLPWILGAKKPLSKGLKQGMALLKIDPSCTAIIGDQMLTDILGGNCLGLTTILVEPISSKEAFVSKLQRPIEKLLGRKSISRKLMDDTPDNVVPESSRRKP